MYKIALVLILNISFLFAAVDAKLEIIKKVKNIPSITVSIANDSAENVILTKLKELLENDLDISGFYKMVDTNINSPFNEIPTFEKEVDLFVSLSGRESSFGGYILSLRLFDNNTKELLLDKKLTTSDTERYPFLAHRGAILISKKLNAPSIDWMDKFVVFSVSKGRGKADILIGDFTLTYTKTIVKGGLNLFPKWADKTQKNIYYTSYDEFNPTLIKLDIFTRKKEKLMVSEGMIVCSDVSKDETKLLVTASPNGLPDIYLFDLKTKKKKRITTYSGIDVGAHFIDNEKRIVFVSDRLSTPNIFAKTIGAKGVERLVYHGNNNSSATTFNDKIVYSSRDSKNQFENRSFNLYLMSTKSDYLKRLTSNGVNQFPKFSTDGDTLLYIKTFNNKSSLGILRLRANKSVLFPLENGKIQSIDW